MASRNLTLQGTRSCSPPCASTARCAPSHSLHCRALTFHNSQASQRCYVTVFDVLLFGVVACNGRTGLQGGAHATTQDAPVSKPYSPNEIDSFVDTLTRLKANAWCVPL